MHNVFHGLYFMTSKLGQYSLGQIWLDGVAYSCPPWWCFEVSPFFRLWTFQKMCIHPVSLNEHQPIIGCEKAQWFLGVKLKSYDVQLRSNWHGLFCLSGTLKRNSIVLSISFWLWTFQNMCLQPLSLNEHQPIIRYDTDTVADLVPLTFQKICIALMYLSDMINIEVRHPAVML